MLSNPYLMAPTQAAAWVEGFAKGYLNTASSEPSENVGEADFDAFNQGISDGFDAQRNGVAFDQPCLAALEEHGPGHEVGMAINGVELLHGAWEARHLTTLAGGIAGGLVALIELACTLPVHTLPPEQVLPALGQPLVDTLAGFGLTSAAFYIGAGLDAGQQDCEIKLTPLFATADQAFAAVQAMQRPNWAVASWRTDACGSFHILE